jgi:prephenate dehydrogenase
MATLAIVGTGLLGSSLGLAAKKAGKFDRLIGVSSPAVVGRALEIGAVDVALPLEEALLHADVVVLAQPVRRILALISQINPLVREGALVTDVGSTKGAICAAARQQLTRCRFVGGHPMAGKETRGPEGATADLFAGRPWILTEHEPFLEDMVQSFGARVVTLDAETHDRMVSLSSHLPQLVSTSLASMLHDEDLRQVAGPGLHDMTRLALSSYALWEDILLTNADNIDAALGRMIEELGRMRESLRTGVAAAPFERGGEMSRKLRNL